MVTFQKNVVFACIFRVNVKTVFFVSSIIFIVLNPRFFEAVLSSRKPFDSSQPPPFVSRMSQTRAYIMECTLLHIRPALPIEDFVSYLPFDFNLCRHPEKLQFKEATHPTLGSLVFSAMNSQKKKKKPGNCHHLKLFLSHNP